MSQIPQRADFSPLQKKFLIRLAQGSSALVQAAVTAGGNFRGINGHATYTEVHREIAELFGFSIKSVKAFFSQHSKSIPSRNTIGREVQEMQMPPIQSTIRPMEDEEDEEEIEENGQDLATEQDGSDPLADFSGRLAYTMKVVGKGIAGPATAKSAWMMCNMRDWDMNRVNAYLNEHGLGLGNVSGRWLRVAMHRWKDVSESDRVSYQAKAMEDKEYTLRDIVSNPELFEKTQLAICKRLIKSLENLASELNHAGAHLHWVTLRPDGRRSQLQARGGFDVAAALANRYCPFTTMEDHALQDRIPINVSTARRSPVLASRSGLDVLLIRNPTVKQARAQITTVMHKVLADGGLIRPSEKVPWGSLQQKLDEAHKYLDGWPELSRPYAGYASFTKEDGIAVMAARDDIGLKDVPFCGPSSTPSHIGDVVME